MASSANEDGIRPYRPSDLKQTRLLIGSSAMEQLASANYKAYRHPTTLLFWMLSTGAYMWITKWYPNTENWSSFLAPVIAAFTTSVPILLAFEWLHRGYFERLVRTTLSSTDLIAPETFYSASPSSSCLVYSHKGVVISVVAIDAAHAGEDLDALLQDEEEDKKKAEAEKSERDAAGSTAKSTAREGTTRTSLATLGGKTKNSSVGLLRHYHTDLAYIYSPLPADILTESISHAFSRTSALQRIYVRSSPTAPQKTALYKSLGFKPSQEGPRQGGRESEEAFVGLFGWRKGWLKLDREAWESRERSE